MQKDFSEELKKECAAIKKSADLNKAAASLKLHNYKDAIAAASKVSAILSKSIKPSFGLQNGAAIYLHAFCEATQASTTPGLIA